MPLYLMPWRTIQNSAASPQAGATSGSQGGGGAMASIRGERGSPGAPWQGAQPSS